MQLPTSTKHYIFLEALLQYSINSKNKFYQITNSQKHVHEFKVEDIHLRAMFHFQNRLNLVSP